MNKCLFGSVRPTKSADPDKQKYSRYSIGFDYCSEFLFIGGTMRKNVIIFGDDTSLSMQR